jgi:hypothetical protein
LSIEGSAIRPIDVVAAPLMPTIAANIVQMSTVPAASPPRSPPIQWYISSYISSAMPHRCNMAPMNMNMGTATSRNMSMDM